MAMAEPMVPIDHAHDDDDHVGERRSATPVVCIAVKMLLVVRPLPQWSMQR